ncbi:hypothetical protein [Mycobacterium botniense]|uniref:Uncharacterized protein n=1 Tax=Mycobacterium botniense TaxID=84962 RepID=A0A7I9Y0M7_9MYCO|nr:hypothetical protein [Mycobacterium botniense]GFG75570.1 hypothetical protein MBOT_29350 [Mycobacterium botniense]
MTGKRETPVGRRGDRRGGHGDAHRKSALRPADPPPRRARARRGKAGAPDRGPRVARSGPQTAPLLRPAERQARPTSTSQAKARAKARKAKAPKLVRAPLRDRVAARLASIDLRPRTLAAKVPFVVLVIGSLGIGLGLTLWLSTDSAERSYQLGKARTKNQILQQQKEALERDVLQAQSAPALAEAARKLGMIPTKDTAHLIQDPTGNWVVVGTPKPAEGMPLPPLNTKLPDEKPAPPPPPPAEVPVRVSPRAGVPTPRTGSGPEVLVRAPDGATTLGTQHLPGRSGSTAAAPLPGPLPAGRGIPPNAAAAPTPPGAVVFPPAIPGSPAAVPSAPTPLPAPGAAPSATGAGAGAPETAVRAEQFGPVIVATPGTAR